MKTILITAVVPLLIGPITFVIMQNIKHASHWVDSLSPTAKRLAVLGIAAVVTSLGHMAGVEIQCDPSGQINCLNELDKDAVSTIMSAAIAFLMHQYRQLSKDA